VLIHGLVAVANGTEPHAAAIDELPHAGKVAFFVDNAGGQDHFGSRDRGLIRHNHNEFLTVPIQTAHAAGTQFGSILRGLRPEFLQQVRPRNSACDPLHAFLWGGKSAVFACGGKERFM
jgi:hypothetical protein